MPAVTGLRTPPVTQGNVLALHATGTPKRKIARKLGIDKGTVDSILKAYGHNQSDAVSKIQQVVPLAYTALEKGLTSADALGAGKLGLDFLKSTVLQPAVGDKYTINGDVQLQQALTLLPAAPMASAPALPTTTSTPSLPSSTSTQGAGATEAAANPPANDIGLSLHPNFSTFSTEQLRAELARRESAGAQVIDVEVVEP